jgi:hypothetical protein
MASAWSTPGWLTAVPQREANDVTVLGKKDIRFWGDEASLELIADGISSYRHELATWRAAAAAAYMRGRLLLIGQTNIDEGRSVVWDIACSLRR